MPSSYCVNLWDSRTESQRVLEQISISTPSRLHFGMFSIGDLVLRKFGGIGLMIDSPRTIVTASSSERLEIRGGPEIHPCRASVKRWFDRLSFPLSASLSIESMDEIPVCIEIESVPPRHCGFGSGTQLALSTVMALSKFLKLSVPGPEELATIIGRGKRSGIGSYGFYHGGFLVDRGRLPDERLAPLDFHTSFPEPWTIVCVLHKDANGLWGDKETSAFDQLPRTTEKQRDEMIEIVRERIIPGILQRNFDSFSEGIYEFGRRSGMMYAEIQNGPYNGPQIGDLIERIRGFGVKAVGQSSWGPCVFAITRNDGAAQQLVGFLRSHYGNQCVVMTAKSDNTGARCIEKITSEKDHR